MFVSVSEAKGQLTELVRRAEAGDEVILTRHGNAAVRLVAMKKPVDAKHRRQILERAIQISRQAQGEQPIAARSQDFLYSDAGMP